MNNNIDNKSKTNLTDAEIKTFLETITDTNTVFEIAGHSPTAIWWNIRNMKLNISMEYIFVHITGNHFISFDKGKKFLEQRISENVLSTTNNQQTKQQDTANISIVYAITQAILQTNKIKHMRELVVEYEWNKRQRS